MNKLRIVIDNTVHEYTEVELPGLACKTCSLHEYCSSINTDSSLCKEFDLTGKSCPCGYYGKFVIKRYWDLEE